MRGNGADYGIEKTRKQGTVLPLIHDRASKPIYTDEGGLQAFAVLGSKNDPPEWADVSMPSNKPGFRWYWIFLVVAAAHTAPYWWPLIAPLLAVAAQ